MPLCGIAGQGPLVLAGRDLAERRGDLGHARRGRLKGGRGQPLIRHARGPGQEVAEQPGQGAGVGRAGQPGDLGERLVELGHPGQRLEGGRRLVEPGIQRAPLGHAAPDKGPPLHGRAPRRRQGGRGLPDLAERLDGEVRHRGQTGRRGVGDRGRVGDHPEDVVQRVSERVTCAVHGLGVGAELLTALAGRFHVRRWQRRGRDRHRVQRLAQRSRHLLARRLVRVKLKQVGAQAGAGQPVPDHLERGRLLRHEQHGFPGMQRSADDVRDRLALARAGRAVQHERPAVERGRDGGPL
jgi:hypothetical protein